jgi:G3E family GTPase
MTATKVLTETEQFEVPKRGMPVTIITGFLGSGKTTFLNYILQNCQDLKVAVLVNEFGDIDIDSQLLVSIDEDMMQLSNGCICCTINDGLVDAVYSILEREERIDHLVVETTGVADPLPIAMTFLSQELRKLTRLDSILTVVDSEEFNAENFGSQAALNQIIYGDIILLNKTDLVSQEKLNELEDYINTVKEGARILRTLQAQVPLPFILDVELSKLNSQTPSEKDPQHHHHAHDHHHDHDEHEHHYHSDHLANDGFVSVSFQSDRPFRIEKFQTFLMENMSLDVFRAKGILWFKESPLCHIFQLSGKRYDLNTEQWLDPPRNKLVLIGRNLHADELREQLTSCLE